MLVPLIILILLLLNNTSLDSRLISKRIIVMWRKAIYALKNIFFKYGMIKLIRKRKKILVKIPQFNTLKGKGFHKKEFPVKVTKSDKEK